MTSACGPSHLDFDDLTAPTGHPPVQFVGRWRRLGDSLGFDLSRCRWLEGNRQAAEDRIQRVCATWRVSVGLAPVRAGMAFPPVSAVTSNAVQALPSPVGRAEAPILPRMEEGGQSHAQENEALRVGLLAEPHGPSDISGEGTLAACQAPRGERRGSVPRDGTSRGRNQWSRREGDGEAWRAQEEVPEDQHQPSHQSSHRHSASDRAFGCRRAPRTSLPGS